MIVYLNGKYLALDEVKISPFDRGFLFGDGVYEVIRTYKGKLFRFNSHIKRLNYSLSEIKLNFSNLNDFESIAYTLAEMNNLLPDDFSTYIQITRGAKTSRQHYFEQNCNPTVFVTVTKVKNNEEQVRDGVKVILTEDIRWSRCDIKSISLLPAILSKTNAVNSGAYDSIFHRDNKITEGSHTNFFGVKDGVVYTAPLSNLILEGITREVVIELCNKNKLKVIEDYIKVDDLKIFDEFFITGTISEITPVVQINDLIVGNGLPGKLTSLIQRYFHNYVNST